MFRVRNHLDIAAIAFAWSGLAVLTLALAEIGDARVFIWLPGGVSVAAFFGLPRRRWLRLAGLLIACSVMVNAAFGVDVMSGLGFSFANICAAMTTAMLGRRMVAGRSLDRLDLADFLRLTLAAAIGAACSATVASFFWTTVSGGMGFAWWFLAVFLGILTVGPPAMALRAKLLWGRRPHLHSMQLEVTRGLFICFLGCLALALWTLVETRAPIMFMVLVGTVFAVTRYGHLGASVGILAVAVAGTITSFGGAPAIRMMPVEPMAGTIVLQVFMAIVYAACLPLAVQMIERDRMATRLMRRNRALDRTVGMLGMAERLAGVARWRYDHAAHRQTWSGELLRIHGLPPGNEPNEAQRRAMTAGGTDFVLDILPEFARRKKPYSFEFEILRTDGKPRMLRMFAQNEFDDSGRLEETFGVVIDIDDDHRRAEALSAERGLALQLAERARQDAQTDALTGLANRRLAMEVIDGALRDRSPNDAPLALVVFDIDHFKQVNDIHGHPAGDEVLRKVGAIARRHVRDGDLVARIGGEEFVWLLRQAEPRLVRLAAERLRRAIEAESGCGPVPPVTVSMGLAYAQPGDVLDAFFARADAALYVAKHQGRNCLMKAA